MGRDINMKKTVQLSLAVALALTGCATNDRGPVDDGDDGSGSGSDTTPPPAPEMQFAGAYRLDSTFDLATNLPGGTGSFLGELIEATDDSDDPMSWVVDKMLAQMDDGTLKDILVGAKPFVIDYLNDQVTSLAPDLVGKLTQLGQNMADATKHFGLDEQLEIAADPIDNNEIGKITVDGVHFTVNGVTTDHLFADYDLDNVVAPGVSVALDAQSKLLVGQHTLPLPYGQLARIALDAAAIPAIDPNAHSLQELLSNAVDCQAVGQSIADALDIGGASFFASACTGGMGVVADEIYDQLLGEDTILSLHISGDARATDVDGDYKIDRLSSGKWTGTMTLDATDAPLADPATFTGMRTTIF